MIILSFVIAVVLTLCRTPKATTVLAGAAFLAAVSVLSQSYPMVMYFGYGIPPGIGYVTGVAAAAVLFITLLVQRKLSTASEKVASHESVAEIVLSSENEPSLRE